MFPLQWGLSNVHLSLPFRCLWRPVVSGWVDRVAAWNSCFLILITTLNVGAMPLELGSLFTFILVFEEFLKWYCVDYHAQTTHMYWFFSEAESRSIMDNVVQWKVLPVRTNHLLWVGLILPTGLSQWSQFLCAPKILVCMGQMWWNLALTLCLGISEFLHPWTEYEL